ncbi:anthranilate synthase component I family protein [Solitalea lacus]|uniref:anthranilate synthase component I family protein n=1 Tax=Solitalea lacus TaxID=2911172 RepID=UPI001EDB9441|nr:anthranilate synthase component I family protein [Solitalea lacus]UKJ06527.1 anthranilate synthase component I family protein [Solitalea lacus]
MFNKQDIILFKEKALHWASSFNTCCYLDSNNYSDAYGSYDTLIAIDAIEELKMNTTGAFEALYAFQKKAGRNIFGFLTYDLKNELEDLQSNNPDYLHFPILYFFIPRIEIRIKGQRVEIITNDPQLTIHNILEQIENIIPQRLEGLKHEINIQSRISREHYIQKVAKVIEHINRGDIYEMNLCQEFYAENCQINPLQIWKKLNGLSPTPFASFFKHNEHYILCASPERYLQKKGTQLISQPIKGTARRSEDSLKDEMIKLQLYNDPKERAENVMIVDLVRNDLTRCAEPASVKTEELFGIYSFKQVHQMISTVSATINHKLNFIDALKCTYPMGSMTGAPKIRAMQLIEKYEESLRGVYSGSIGYITTEGDFDFNVVIRSILYNSLNSYLSYHVGGAITGQSIAEKEYDECLLKAQAIKLALES